MESFINCDLYFNQIIGKRSRSKVGISSEDETNASKRLKPGINQF